MECVCAQNALEYARVTYLRLGGDTTGFPIPTNLDQIVTLLTLSQSKSVVNTKQSNFCVTVVWCLWKSYLLWSFGEDETAWQPQSVVEMFEKNAN